MARVRYCMEHMPEAISKCSSQELILYDLLGKTFLIIALCEEVRKS
jgi:hypothetical protein